MCTDAFTLDLTDRIGTDGYIRRQVAEQLAAAGMWFDATTHRYFYKHQIAVPNVTRILTTGGLRSSFAHVPRAVLEAKRQLGQEVHRACHYWDDDDLHSQDGAVVCYLEAWKRFRAETGFYPVLLETLVYKLGMRPYAGTLDRFGRVDLGAASHFAIVDLKIGDPDDAGTAYQTAAYLAALREMLGPPFDNLPIFRWAVQLGGNGRYRLINYTDFRDLMHFTKARLAFKENPMPEIDVSEDIPLVATDEDIPLTAAVALATQPPLPPEEELETFDALLEPLAAFKTRVENELARLRANFEPTRLKIGALANRVMGLKVTSPEALEEIVALREETKAVEAAAIAEIEPFISAAHFLHHSLTDFRGELITKPATRIYVTVDQQTGPYLREQRRREQEEARRIEEEDRRRYEEEKRAEAAAARQAGDVGAAKLLEHEAETATVAPAHVESQARAVLDRSSTTTREGKHKCRLDDAPKAFLDIGSRAELHWIANHKRIQEVLVSLLNDLAKNQGSMLQIAGVSVYQEDPSLASRSSRGR